jgi:hypothetical protein
MGGARMDAGADRRRCGYRRERDGGVGTPVTVTAAISDASVLAASAVLRRVDEAGRVRGGLVSGTMPLG